MSKDIEIEVRSAIVRNDKSLKWLAEQLGISQPYLTDILKGKRTGPKAQEHVSKIKKILSIK